jgi:hypothetical protein
VSCGTVNRGGRASRLTALALLCGTALLPAPAPAQVATGQGASIVIFPYVVADGQRDTIIELSNIGNPAVLVRCAVVRATGSGGGSAPLPGFRVFLVKQQPTHWFVSRGRAVDALDGCVNAGTVTGDCDGAGIDPGTIPAAPGFRGELVCVETDDSGSPIGGNHLLGTATVIDQESGDVSAYRAVGFLGTEFNDGNNTLCLAGAVSETCPNGAEYDACPEFWHLAHPADGSGDALIGAGAAVTTSIVAAPCGQDLGDGEAPSVQLQFDLFNEFENHFSVAAMVQSGIPLPLAAIDPIFTRAQLGSDYVYTRVHSSQSAFSGLVMTAITSRSGPMGEARSAVDPVADGARPGPDLLVLPSE